MARRFAGELRIPLPGTAAVLRLLRLTKSTRSPYDALMLQLHDRMKARRGVSGGRAAHARRFSRRLDVDGVYRSGEPRRARGAASARADISFAGRRDDRSRALAAACPRAAQRAGASPDSLARPSCARRRPAALPARYFARSNENRHLHEVTDAVGRRAVQQIGQKPVAVRGHRDEIDVLCSATLTSSVAGSPIARCVSALIPAAASSVCSRSRYARSPRISSDSRSCSSSKWRAAHPSATCTSSSSRP